MPQNKSIVRDFVHQTLNQGHTHLTANFVHEDAIEQVPFPGQGPGRQGIQDLLGLFRTAFPDLHFNIEEQIAEDDKVVSRFEWTGTHRALFLGVPATNKPVRVWGIVIDRLVDGKIKDTRLIMDTLGLMIQLGAIPAPG